MRRLARESPGRSDGSLLDLSELDLCKAFGAVEANGTVNAVRWVGVLLFGKEDALRRLQPTHELAWANPGDGPVAIVVRFRAPAPPSVDVGRWI